MLISSEITDSIETRFSKIARERNSRGEKILSLGLGEPGFSTPQPIKNALNKAIQDGYTRYSSAQGLFELREIIAKQAKLDWNLDVTTNEIVITPGAKHALSLALMAILKPYDEVIIFTPCYPSYRAQILLAEPTAKIHEIELRSDDFSIDYTKLKAALSNNIKAIIFNFPHNPTGSMLDDDDLKKIESLLCNNNCFIISDEIYEKLDFTGEGFRSLYSLTSLSGRVISINGFSKAYSMAGWRIGWLNAPKEILREILLIHQHINTHTCTFVQKAATACFDMEMDFLESYNSELNEKAMYLLESIEKLKTVKLCMPKGGLFAFLDISKTNMSSDDFASSLLEKNSVALTPGKVFGSKWDNHVRISLAAEMSEFKEAVSELVIFISQLECST